MLAIVRLALRRPYTFVVMAILIAIYGTLAAIRTPVDIFPNIGIPVISVIWSYTGLPPDDMSGRIVYFYERSLTTTVNDIEHIESQSVAGYGIVKIFFQPTVDINAAQAQVTAVSQTVLKLLPPGVTPPLVLTYSASSLPIIQVALFQRYAVAGKAQRSRTKFYSPAACHRGWGGFAIALWRRGTASAGRSRSTRPAFLWSVSAERRHCAFRTKSDHACRHRENREV